MTTPTRNNSPIIPIYPPHETMSWSMQSDYIEQSIFLAECAGWKIIRKDEDKATNLVSVVATRILMQQKNDERTKFSGWRPF